MIGSNYTSSDFTRFFRSELGEDAGVTAVSEDPLENLGDLILVFHLEMICLARQLILTLLLPPPRRRGNIPEHNWGNPCRSRSPHSLHASLRLLSPGPP